MKKLLILSVCSFSILNGCSSLEVNKSSYSGKTVSYIVDKNDTVEIQFNRIIDKYIEHMDGDTVYENLGFSCSETICQLQYKLTKTDGISRNKFFNELNYAVVKTENIKGSQKIFSYTAISKTERKKINLLETILTPSLGKASLDPDYYLANPANIRVIIEKDIPSKYQTYAIAGNFYRLGYFDPDANKYEYKVNINSDSYRATIPVEFISSFDDKSITRVKCIDFKFKESSYIKDISSAKKEVMDEIEKIINL